MRRIHWVGAIPFFLIHLACLAAFFMPFHWGYVALAIGLYYLRMFAITAGYHRYFAHRTYKMARFPQFLMAFLGGTSTQKGALWWAAHHRVHHKYTDQAEDLHSPLQHGFWWSHLGWILARENDETRWEQIPDLARFPELRWLNKHHLVPPTVLGLVLFLAGGWGAFVWGFLISTVMLWHGTFFINSLAHVYGSQRYDTGDTSRNNFWLSIVCMGEGWHNNHHCYMSSANQGFYWWEWDPSFYALRALSWVGITKDLRKPPLEILEAKRFSRRERKAKRARPTRAPDLRAS